MRGLIIAVAGGSLMAVLALSEVFNVWAVILPQALFMIGTGMVLPQTMAGALANFPSMAGSASALFGFTQMAVAAVAGMLVGHLHDGTSLVMAPDHCSLRRHRHGLLSGAGSALSCKRFRATRRDRQLRQNHPKWSTQST